MTLDPPQIRRQLRFDVARLRAAAEGLAEVDGKLRDLKRRLQERARQLASEADGGPRSVPVGDRSPVVAIPSLRAAQAQATAELARRAALGEILKQQGAVSLVATMAVARWLEALMRSLPEDGRSLEARAAAAKSHIDAGRLAHRVLRATQRGAGLVRGCGKLTCAVVVCELAPADLREELDAHVRDGWARAMGTLGHDTEAALAGVSAALREGARLLEGVARRAGPAADELLARAEAVEVEVEVALERSIPGA